MRMETSKRRARNRTDVQRKQNNDGGGGGGDEHQNNCSSRSCREGERAAEQSSRQAAGVWSSSTHASGREVSSTSTWPWLWVSDCTSLCVCVSACLTVCPSGSPRLPRPPVSDLPVTQPDSLCLCLCELMLNYLSRSLATTLHPPLIYPGVYLCTSQRRSGSAWGGGRRVVEGWMRWGEGEGEFGKRQPGELTAALVFEASITASDTLPGLTW